MVQSGPEHSKAYTTLETGTARANCSDSKQTLPVRSKQNLALFDGKSGGKRWPND
jgi:hypothetical protein